MRGAARHPLKWKPSFKYKGHKLNAFVNWMNNRHMIYLKRFVEKTPPPWTHDKILREYKFTNVFRQLDRVTLEWTDRFCKLLHRGKGMTDGDLLFHVVMFRLFNWPPTYDKLFYGMRKDWSKEKAIKLLDEMKEKGEQIFTGAYIVTSGGRRDPKHHTIIEALDKFHEMRDDMAYSIKTNATIEGAVEMLQEIDTVGPFVAYEIACDLRFTRILADAKDRFSWANPGPGAKRGIHRLLTGSKDRPRTKRGQLQLINYTAVMRDLYQYVTKNGVLISGITKGEWPFELREIEHSLCEFDKWERVRNKEGRPRSKFNPAKPRIEFPPYLEKY